MFGREARTYEVESRYVVFQERRSEEEAIELSFVGNRRRADPHIKMAIFTPKGLLLPNILT